MAVKSLRNSSLLSGPADGNSMLAGYSFQDFHHLETVQLGGSAASVTFNNLLQYSGEFRHLQIRAVPRGTNSGTFNFCRIYLNGDTAANYSRHLTFAEGSGIGSYGYSNQNNIGLGYMAGGGSPGSSFGGIVLDMLDAFSSTKFKTATSLFASPNGYNMVGIHSGSWRNLSPISSLTFQPENDSLAAGSRFSLYGIR